MYFLLLIYDRPTLTFKKRHIPTFKEAKVESALDLTGDFQKSNTLYVEYLSMYSILKFNTRQFYNSGWYVMSVLHCLNLPWSRKETVFGATSRYDQSGRVHTHCSLENFG